MAAVQAIQGKGREPFKYVVFLQCKMGDNYLMGRLIGLVAPQEHIWSFIMDVGSWLSNVLT